MRIIENLRLEVRRFIENNERTCGWSDIEQYEFEDELMGFLMNVKELMFRQGEMEYRCEDILMHANQNEGVRSKLIVEALPIKELETIAKEVEENLNDSDRYWEAYWAVFEDTMRNKSWYQDFEEYSEEEFSLYKLYIQDWYATHGEGEPACIDEFLANEMQDEELAKYHKDKLLGQFPDDLIKKIVDRADRLGILKMDRTVACAFMSLAEKHYDLDLRAMLNGRDFDFMHDFVYMPQHFHKETGCFDDRFLPRFSKKSLGGI